MEVKHVYRAVVGSTVHGLAIDGQDDKDEMGIFIEPPDVALGLQKKTHISERTQPDGVRSGPGDLDRISYSLTRFAELVAKGNPSVQLMFFVPDDAVLVSHPAMHDILNDLRLHSASKRVVSAYLGYLRAQRQRMTGERGQKNVNRPELVKKYGYDTKYAMHAARLGIQGVQYAKATWITLPIPSEERKLLRSIRLGEVPESTALDFILGLEEELVTLLHDNPGGLPQRPDIGAISQIVAKAYTKTFWT